MSAAVYILLTRAARDQRLVNLPFSVDRERPEVQQLLVRFMGVVKAVSTVALWYISWRSVASALGRADGLGRAFLPVMLAAIFIPVVFYLVKLRRYRA